MLSFTIKRLIECRAHGLFFINHWRFNRRLLALSSSVWFNFHANDFTFVSTILRQNLQKYFRYNQLPISYQFFLLIMNYLSLFILMMFWKGCLQYIFPWLGLRISKRNDNDLRTIYFWCENFTSTTSVICDPHILQKGILQQAMHIKWRQPILMQVTGAPHPLQSIMLPNSAFSLCHSSGSNKNKYTEWYTLYTCCSGYKDQCRHCKFNILAYLIF